MTQEPVLRTCIVGMGAISVAMWPSLTRHPALQVEAVVDPDSRACERLPSASVAVSLHATLPEALAAHTIELVVINSPAEHHISQAQLSLEAGADVIVAKPLSTSIAEADELIHTAKGLGRSVAVAEQVRFNDHYQHVSSLVADGLIGDVRSGILINAKPRPQPGTLQQAPHPALDENACHHFDALRCVLGERSATAISCREFNPPWSAYAGAAMVNAFITYEDGIEVLYQGGFAARAPMYELRLEGTRGVLRCVGEHMSHGPMRYEHSSAGAEFRELPGHPPVDPAAAWTPYLDAWHGWHQRGGQAPFSAEGALPILTMIEAAKLSARTGARVAIDRLRSKQQHR
jgi:predicted dehydrogenase